MVFVLWRVEIVSVVFGFVTLLLSKSPNYEIILAWTKKRKWVFGQIGRASTWAPQNERRPPIFLVTFSDCNRHWHHLPSWPRPLILRSYVTITYTLLFTRNVAPHAFVHRYRDTPLLTWEGYFACCNVASVISTFTVNNGESNTHRTLPLWCDKYFAKTTQNTLIPSFLVVLLTIIESTRSHASNLISRSFLTRGRISTDWVCHSNTSRQFSRWHLNLIIVWSVPSGALLFPNNMYRQLCNLRSIYLGHIQKPGSFAVAAIVRGSLPRMKSSNFTIRLVLGFLNRVCILLGVRYFVRFDFVFYYCNCTIWYLIRNSAGMIKPEGISATKQSSLFRDIREISPYFWEDSWSSTPV